jgi:hypothetical protein
VLHVIIPFLSGYSISVRLANSQNIFLSCVLFPCLALSFVSYLHVCLFQQLNGQFAYVFAVHESLSITLKVIINTAARVMPKLLDNKTHESGVSAYQVLKPLYRRTRWHLYLCLTTLLVCTWVFHSVHMKIEFPTWSRKTDQNIHWVFNWNKVTKPIRNSLLLLTPLPTDHTLQDTEIHSMLWLISMCTS